MNFRHVWIVFKKEVKDIARDKKTLLTNLLVPIILMPLLFYVMGGSFEKMEKDISENVTVALSADSDTEEIRNLVENEIFASNPNIKFRGVVDDPIQAVRNNEVRFVIDVDKNFAESLEKEKPYTITIIYDQTDSKSSSSYGILAEAISRYNEKIVWKD